MPKIISTTQLINRPAGVIYSHWFKDNRAENLYVFEGLVPFREDETIKGHDIVFRRQLLPSQRTTLPIARPGSNKEEIRYAHDQKFVVWEKDDLLAMIGFMANGASVLDEYDRQERARADWEDARSRGQTSL